MPEAWFRTSRSAGDDELLVLSILYMNSQFKAAFPSVSSSTYICTKQFEKADKSHAPFPGRFPSSRIPRHLTSRHIPEMLVLPVRDIVIQLNHGIVLRVTFGKETVPAFVGNDETQTKAEDDAELETSRGHADDDPCSVDGRLFG